MSTAEPPSRYAGYVRATLANRIPAIIRMAEEGQDAEVVRQLHALARSIEADGPMVLDYASWQLPGWEALPGRVNGRRPSAAAFFDFEHWLYFRILTAVRYPETRADPFRFTKHRDLARHIDWAEQAIQTTKTFADALRLSLDANAHDLSQLTGAGQSFDVGRSRLDIDAAGVSRLNIIADNFGGEFVADLLLATIAAEAGIEVVVHVKALPMFVSDTTADDLIILFDRLRPASVFARRLQSAVDRGAMRFASNWFWSSPQYFDRLPVEELGSGEGVVNVLKGDLNFRRAIGDVTVPVETAFERLPTLPAVPMLSLRSIKSYCAAGMADWPVGLSRTDFPMDGSIVVVQRIPARS